MSGVNGSSFEAVLFDYAGVLVSSPKGIMNATAAASGLTMEEFAPLILGPVDVDGDHPLHQLERGEISMDRFTELIDAMAKEAGGLQFLGLPSWSEVTEHFRPAEEMLSVARDAGDRGYKTAIVSNNYREWHLWPTIIDAHNIFDEIVDSSAVGVRKPDPAIFELTLDRLGISDPATAVFVDDFEWNLPPARGLGMHTIHLQDHATAAAELRELLGLVST